MSLKIYLAGKMSGLSFNEMNEWRNEAVSKLYNEADYCGKSIKVVNPVTYYNFEEKRHQTEIEVKEFDLTHVITSDIIIVNLVGLSDSIGTIIELHDAYYHHKIPVIAFGEKNLYDNLHPWVQNEITRVESSLDNAIEYIKEFYMR